MTPGSNPGASEAEKLDAMEEAMAGPFQRHAIGPWLFEQKADAAIWTCRCDGAAIGWLPPEADIAAMLAFIAGYDAGAGRAMRLSRERAERALAQIFGVADEPLR